MKHRTILISIITLISGSCLARDFEFTYEGSTLTYTVLDEEAKTCKTKDGILHCGNVVSGDLTIPEIADGYTVTTIGSNAFYKCTDLSSVTIPNSVRHIDKYAFYGCSSLESVILGNSVEIIDNNAFYECKSLSSINIPNTVTTIGQSVFYMCESLTSIELPNSITSIDNMAFERCSGLTTVKIPDSLTYIDTGVFSGCSGLTSVEIPNTITELGSSAFRYCSKLTYVKIPESVTTIGGYTFYGSGLTTLDIPSSIKNIYEYAFYSCNNLTEINCHSLVNAPNNVFSATTYYNNATLYVAPDDLYWAKKRTPWSLFKRIQEKDFSEIKELETTDSTIRGYYNTCGRRFDNPQPGINIVEKADGATYKIFVK